MKVATEKLEMIIVQLVKGETVFDGSKTSGEDIKLIIDKLYALRAIISIISIEINKIYNTEHKLSSKKKMIQIAEFYNYFYTSYLSTFKDVIDENDWENIDLFIYMLETKSATTPKGAIEQVDLYSHIGNISDVSLRALEFICYKIQYESNKIENAIVSNIKSINKHNSVLQNSVIALELLNAMTEKSNSTSKQMADDIAKIKRFVSGL